MDKDGYLDGFMDPWAGIFKEVELDDIFNLLGEPAKSLRVLKNLQFDIMERMRAISMVLIDFGKKCKYLFSLNIRIT